MAEARRRGEFTGLDSQGRAMNRHTDHDLMRLAMDIWQAHKHTSHTDVTLRQFVGVFHAVIEAIREREAQRDRPI